MHIPPLHKCALVHEALPSLEQEEKEEGDVAANTGQKVMMDEPSEEE